jgi:ribosomal protein S19E (S16A)
MAAVTLKDAPADHVITTYAALLKRQGKVRLLPRGRKKTVKN